MITYGQIIDEAARIGDHAKAIRGLWADMAEREQATELNLIAPYLTPEAFLPLQRTYTRLKRTFNQKDGQGGFIKFWRVVGPVTHRHYQSDLSLMSLKGYGLI